MNCELTTDFSCALYSVLILMPTKSNTTSSKFESGENSVIRITFLGWSKQILIGYLYLETMDESFLLAAVSTEKSLSCLVGFAKVLKS